MEEMLFAAAEKVTCDGKAATVALYANRLQIGFVDWTGTKHKRVDIFRLSNISRLERRGKRSVWFSQNGSWRLHDIRFSRQEDADRFMEAIGPLL